MTDTLYLYDPRMDTLHVWPGGKVLRAVTYVGDDYRDTYRDPWHREVVIGYQFGHFLRRGIYHWPGLYDHLEAAGIPRWKRWRVRLMFWVYEWLWRMP